MMGDSRGIAVGSSAPDFTAPLIKPDGSAEDVTFSDRYTEQPALLVFYTNDFSPDCIEEWCSFRDYAWFTSGEDVQVIGVSKSHPFTHRRFIDYLDLDFPLYSDRDLSISEAYGVAYRALKVLPRSRRSVFLVDTDGVVRYKWVADHPLDPTRDTPPLREIHDAVEGILDTETETFGFD